MHLGASDNYVDPALFCQDLSRSVVHPAPAEIPHHESTGEQHEKGINGGRNSHVRVFDDAGGNDHSDYL